jgi:hypothetical protein
MSINVRYASISYRNITVPCANAIAATIRTASSAAKIFANRDGRAWADVEGTRGTRRREMPADGNAGGGEVSGSGRRALGAVVIDY